MKIFNTTTLFAAAITAFGALGATTALACEWGNACDGSGTGNWVGGSGYVAGGGEGWANANNDATGDIIDRGSFAQSESGFTGSFRFAEDDCGDCVADTNAVFGSGFTNNFAGSFVQSGGGSAMADSYVGGVAAGEGAAWSMKSMLPAN